MELSKQNSVEVYRENGRKEFGVISIDKVFKDLCCRCK